MHHLESERNFQETSSNERLENNDFKLDAEALSPDVYEEDLEQKKMAQAGVDAERVAALKKELSSRPVEEVASISLPEEKIGFQVPVRHEGLENKSPESWFKKARRSFSEWLTNSEKMPDDNILYRPDRMYRCIGIKGYEDFVKTGKVRSKNRTLYVDVSFNQGRPAPPYRKGDSGAYILEATEDAANFEYKTHPFSGQSMKDISYRGITGGELDMNSKIRIYRRIDEKTFDVVFDNIGDEALRKEE